MGTLCLAHSKRLDSRKESRCSAQTILFVTSSLGTVSYPYQLWIFSLPNSDSHIPAKGQP